MAQKDVLELLYRAPSWSWAVTDDPVSYTTPTEVDCYTATFINFWTELASADGMIVSGELVIDSQWMLVSFGEKGNGWGNKPCTSNLTSDLDGRCVDFGTATLDDSGLVTQLILSKCLKRYPAS
jgi:hypothetical protein